MFINQSGRSWEGVLRLEARIERNTLGLGSLMSALDERLCSDNAIAGGGGLVGAGLHGTFSGNFRLY